MGHWRCSRRLDAGPQGDGRGPRRRGERDRQTATDRLPLGSQRHLYAARGRQRGLDRGPARSEGAEVKVSQFPFSANPKARFWARSTGWCGLSAKRAPVVSSVRLMGPHATDLVAELAFAVQFQEGHGRRSSVDDSCPPDAAGGNARSCTGVPRCSHPHAVSMRKRHVRIP